MLWLCKCRCGNEVTVNGCNLRNEHTKSCGCLSAEKAAERCTKHGLYVSHPRLLKTIANHFKWIKIPIGCYEGWQIDPRYTLDSTGVVKFCEDLIASRPEECERYERDKSLNIDKDNDRNRIFRPESIVFVSRKENQNNRRNTVRLEDGTSLAMFCDKVGIQTRKNGESTKQYKSIQYTYRKHHKGHPELIKRANELIALFTKCLNLLKLRDDVRSFASDAGIPLRNTPQ